MDGFESAHGCLVRFIITSLSMSASFINANVIEIGVINVILLISHL